MCGQRPGGDLGRRRAGAQGPSNLAAQGARGDGGGCGPVNSCGDGDLESGIGRRLETARCRCGRRDGKRRSVEKRPGETARFEGINYSVNCFREFEMGMASREGPWARLLAAMIDWIVALP